MERLTVDYGKKFSPFRYAMKDGSDAEIGYFKNYDAFYSHMLMVQKLGEYEDLEEQGLLLRLPCKVGSTLYQPISNQINEYKAIGLCFDITRNEFMYEVAYQIGLQWYKTTCDFDCINKTVFLTQAEAEQKLKAMESD